MRNNAQVRVTAQKLPNITAKLDEQPPRTMQVVFVFNGNQGAKCKQLPNHCLQQSQKRANITS